MNHGALNAVEAASAFAISPNNRGEHISPIDRAIVVRPLAELRSSEATETATNAWRSAP
jgi:hypothetical protein